MFFNKVAFVTVVLLLTVLPAKSFDFDSSVRLYENGLYPEAFQAFDELQTSNPSALNAGYRLLCMEKMKSPHCEQAIVDYERAYGISSLSDELYLLHGLNLFDQHLYKQASAYLGKVQVKDVPKKLVPEFLFKQAYCEFGLGNYKEAKSRFEKVASMPHSVYTAPTRYSLGYIAYDDGQFEDAYGWFSKAAKDKRFEQTSRYYMLECRFMLKDYSYVMKNGDELYREIPDERKPHLARILSETYLVNGDSAKAKEYYDLNAVTGTPMNRSDYFYAGSLQYALGNYQGAVDNFSRMTARTDSLGQIASYEMGYSYIQTKNKVAAMAAFEEASQCPYDARIREDAFFNHAKLAFDLNHDPSVFEKYLETYRNTSRKEQIYDYIAVACLMNRNYAGAVAAYDRIDELDARMKANYAKANYLRAEQLISKGSYSEAIKLLKVASYYTGRNDNFGKLVRYWLAESYYRSENHTEAAKLFTDLYNISALDGRPEGIMLPYNIAYCYYRKSDYDQAAKWYDTYLQTGDGKARIDAVTRRADCDFMRKDYKNAVKRYASVVEDIADPDVVYPYYRMGLACGLDGDKNGKIVALLPVLKASPTSHFYSDALFELGRAYVDSKKESDAVNCFKTLVETSRDSIFVARALIEMGMIARNRSDVENALACYGKVVEEYRSTGFSEDALLAIEAIYQSQGEPEKFVEYSANIGKPVAKTPEEIENIYFNSAEQMYLTENFAKALVSLQKYVDAYPQGSKLPQVYYYMADSYKRTGNREKALEYYRKVIDLAGGTAYAESSMLAFAGLSFEMQRYEDAYRSYFSLLDAARVENNVMTAKVGMMRSAFKAMKYNEAISAASLVRQDGRADAGLMREADYVQAKSFLATSRRSEAYSLFSALSASPATDEGAESMYLIIQDTYDRGEFNKIADMVYDFSSKAPDQSYWLAKSFVVLGDSFAENGQFKQANATFQSLLDGYKPQSGDSDDVTDAVRMRLEKIKELL